MSITETVCPYVCNDIFKGDKLLFDLKLSATIIPIATKSIGMKIMVRCKIGVCFVNEYLFMNIALVWLMIRLIPVEK